MSDNKIILGIKAKNNIKMDVLPPSLTLTDVERAEQAADIAMKWAESSDSPDGQDDKESPTGKTQSAKSWALGVKTDAQKAANAAANASASETNAADSASAAETAKNEAEQIAANIGNPVIEVSENGGTITVKDSLGQTVTFKLVKTVQGLTADDNGNVDLLKNLIKNTPEFYQRQSLPVVTKDSITIKAGTQVNINNEAFISTKDVILQSSAVGTADERKGKDVYIYACASNNSEPAFVLSMNHDAPDGYTMENSRKIGGFHCLCADVGSIEGHNLNGYLAGDILPASVWDLLHRPRCAPEGMVYIDVADVWMDIYLLSWNGSELVSINAGTIADGTSVKPWHGEAMLEQLMKQNKRLPWRAEFQMAAKGSNEQTNIQGSSDPITTGGHVDTSGRRMISNYGLEDTCGVLWQWLMDLGFAGGSGWTNSVYNSTVDERSYGQSYGNLYRLLGGVAGLTVRPAAPALRLVAMFRPASLRAAVRAVRLSRCSEKRKLIVGLL